MHPEKPEKAKSVFFVHLHKRLGSLSSHLALAVGGVNL